MGRFHKTYAVNGDIDTCKKYIEDYLLNRGYQASEAYYGKRMFIAYDSSMPTVLGADNNMRFIDVAVQGGLIVVEAWILRAWAVAGDRNWTNDAFITKLDKNEIDPSEDGNRFKAMKKDLLTVLEDIVAITEEYNARGRVDAAYLLPSDYCLKSECEDLSDFIKTIAPKSVAICLTKQCVFAYVMAFFAIVAAITTSMWTDILQIALIVILAAVVQIKKSRIFANTLFILCVCEVLLPFFFTSSSNWVTWLLLVDAYLMTNTFKNAERMFGVSAASLAD